MKELFTRAMFLLLLCSLFFLLHCNHKRDNEIETLKIAVNQLKTVDLKTVTSELLEHVPDWKKLTVLSEDPFANYLPRLYMWFIVTDSLQKTALRIQDEYGIAAKKEIAPEQELLEAKRDTIQVAARNLIEAKLTSLNSAYEGTSEIIILLWNYSIEADWDMSKTVSKTSKLLDSMFADQPGKSSIGEIEDWIVKFSPNQSDSKANQDAHQLLLDYLVTLKELNKMFRNPEGSLTSYSTKLHELSEKQREVFTRFDITNRLVLK